MLFRADQLDEEDRVVARHPSRHRRGEDTWHDGAAAGKDGRPSHSLTISPIRDERAGRRRRRVRKIAQADITERKRLEDELRQVAAELSDADRRKDEFLAMLAHELRNPLAAIGNAVKLASKTDAREQLDWSMEVITRQMQHLTRLIDDLMDVSRISRGKIELRRDILEVAPILESAVATVGTLVEERKHTLETAIDRGNLWVNVDPTRLEQVVVNLLNNAAKYSENGGPHPALGPDRGGRSRHQRQGQGRRHPAREAPRDVRAVRPGGPLARPLRGGARDRPHGGEEARRDARRQHRGRERRARQGERVHHPAPRREEARQGASEA